ncbi:MAG: hypothetical protein ACNA7G_13915, partial [Methylobacter sp.]
DLPKDRPGLVFIISELALKQAWLITRTKTCSCWFWSMNILQKSFFPFYTSHLRLRIFKKLKFWV